MAEKRGQYQYNDDGSVSSLVAGDIAIEESKAIVPVDIQARLSQTIQTHNAVSVAANGNSSGVWIDCDGFDKLALTIINDNATTQNSLAVRWSHDGTTVHGYESPLNAAVGQQRSAITDTKARYAQVAIYNNDSAVAHTMSAWSYLKS